MRSGGCGAGTGGPDGFGGCGPLGGGCLDAITPQAQLVDRLDNYWLGYIKRGGGEYSGHQCLWPTRDGVVQLQAFKGNSTRTRVSSGNTWSKLNVSWHVCCPKVLSLPLVEGREERMAGTGSGFTKSCSKK